MPGCSSSSPQRFYPGWRAVIVARFKHDGDGTVGDTYDALPTERIDRASTEVA